MEDIIIKIFSDIGVPAAVCFYTLIVINRSMLKLTDAINKLGDKVDKIDKLELKVELLEKAIQKLL